MARKDERPGSLEKRARGRAGPARFLLDPVYQVRVKDHGMTAHLPFAGLPGGGNAGPDSAFHVALPECLCFGAVRFLPGRNESAVGNRFRKARFMTGIGIQGDQLGKQQPGTPAVGDEMGVAQDKAPPVPPPAEQPATDQRAMFQVKGPGTVFGNQAFDPGVPCPVPAFRPMMNGEFRFTITHHHLQGTSVPVGPEDRPQGGMPAHDDFPGFGKCRNRKVPLQVKPELFKVGSGTGLLLRMKEHPFLGGGQRITIVDSGRRESPVFPEAFERG